MDNTVPVAGHRLERVVDVYCRIAEVLDLLHDRIWPAADKGVAGKHQHRKPI